MLNTHRKFFVALITAALVGLNSFFGLDLGFDSEAIINVAITVLGAVGVERFANKPA